MKLFWWLPFGPVPEIDARELHSRMATSSPPLVLDVRTLGEWSESRIQGSLNIPVTELKSKLGSPALDPQRPIVAVCRSAVRSKMAVRLLRRAGYDAVQLRKGMQAWCGAELPTAGGNS